MKDSEEKMLQVYLAGEDGVSAAFQSVSDEKPSAKLDETIRQAAREAVEGLPVQKKRIPYQAYSIAASFCLAVLVVSLFLNNTGELTRTELESVNSIPLSDSPRVDLFSADETAMPQLNADTVQSIEQDAVSGLNTNRVADPAAAASQEAAQARAERLESAQTISTQDRLAAEEAALATQVQASAVLEADQSMNYRLNSDTWLLEILRLSRTGNTLVLNEERRLFAENYPAIDIDSALAELEETD